MGLGKLTCSDLNTLEAGCRAKANGSATRPLVPNSSRLRTNQKQSETEHHILNYDDGCKHSIQLGINFCVKEEDYSPISSPPWQKGQQREERGHSCISTTSQPFSWLTMNHPHYWHFTTPPETSRGGTRFRLNEADFIAQANACEWWAPHSWGDTRRPAEDLLDSEARRRALKDNNGVYFRQGSNGDPHYWQQGLTH